MAKKIPYAVANYEKIVNEDFYFVDKTRFIRELEKYQVPVFLRPRALWQEPVVFGSRMLLRHKLL